MGLVSYIKRKTNRSPERVRYELLQDYGQGVYGWNGDLYGNELIRTCTRPFATAIGKLNVKHIREYAGETKINPAPYIKILLEEPNPLMGSQMFQEKLANQLILNNNAFAYINRDEYGYPMELYPIVPGYCEAVYDAQRNLYLKFGMKNGRTVTYPYNDVIHLRRDFYDNDIFGASTGEILKPLMDVMVAADQSIVSAIKNSNVLKWLLKYLGNLQPEDLKKHSESFAASFLQTGKNGTGVAAVDSKVEAQQIEPKDYVPNAALTDRTRARLYAFFGTNENIVMAKFNEDEWNAYYESIVEPLAKQLSQELSRKLFTRRERSLGNKIVFDAENLTYSSMKTKLQLVQMVDRAAMSRNEWRHSMNLGKIPGGDELIMRLDTAVVGTNNKDDEDEED